MDFKIIWSLSLFLMFNLLDVFGLATVPLETVSVLRGQNTTLPCQVFAEALKLEGDRVCYLRWSNRTYDGVETQWMPFAVMNEDRGIQVNGYTYKRFNISKDDGALHIHDVQPRDNQKFMCSVVFCSGRSPLKSYVTLNVSDENGLPTKPLDSEIVYARHGQSITLLCSAFGEALQLEGDNVCYVRWSNRTYDGVETQWVPFAMMNGDGGIDVDGDSYKRFNISKDDGGLYIHKAQPCDNQTFMCTVVLCSGRSPLKSYVTLEFLDDKENPATEKPKPSEAAATSGGFRNFEKVKITDPYLVARIVPAIIVTILITVNDQLAFFL